MAVEGEDRSEIGLTGARFGGSRRKRKAGAAPAEAQADPGGGDEWPAVGTTGARFGGGARRRRPPDPEPPAPPPAPVAAPAVPAVVHWPLPAATDPDPPSPDLPESIRVRPYVFTGGRTRGDIELELETLVSAGPRPTRDHQQVVDLCRRPISVAEVAARMGVPLGVARVVVGDLAARGALIVHATGVQDVPELAFLERVLTGLRRL